MSFESKMLCPACKQPTRRTRDDKCLKCKVDIELFTWTYDGKQFKEFRLKHPEKAAEIIHQVESGATVVDAEGRMLTPEGSNPEIIMLSSRPKKYKVTYRQIIPTEWVYCPNCQQRMFQNMVLNSVYLEQEFRCPHCDADTTFYFITNFTTIRR